jgi:hypothetical protein
VAYSSAFRTSNPVCSAVCSIVDKIDVPELPPIAAKPKLALPLTLPTRSHRHGKPCPKSLSMQVIKLQLLFFCPVHSLTTLPLSSRNCLWRTVTRTRYQLTCQRTRLQNQLEALLEEAHLKLSSLVSDLLGVSARRMLEALAEEKLIRRQ